MTLTLDLSKEQETVLREQAAKGGSDEHELALHLLNEALKNPETPKPRLFHETATPEEWVKAWHEWTHSHHAQSAVLLDDSREMIYED